MMKTVSSEMVAISNQSTTERDYWLEKLAGELVLTTFPYDHPLTHTSAETAKETLQFHLTGDLFTRLIKLSNGYDYTLHMILTAGVVALLERYTGHQDIIIGTPIYKQEVEGEFLNTVLALRNQMQENITFKELLLQIRQNIMEATEHQNYPIETLFYKLNLTNHQDQFLFDTAVLLENIHDSRYIEHIKLNSTFSFQRTENDIAGIIEYNPAVYTKATMERIVEQYTRFLNAALTDVNLLINQVELLPEEEKQKLLVDFNQTDVPYSGKRTIYEMFEEQVEKTPEAIAITFEKQTITYRELNNRANQLARVLRSEGVEADQIVGICIERSIEMILGMLAIIKAGGAYLPLDPSYPEERISYMIKDSNMKVLLVDVDIEEEGVKTVNVKAPHHYTGEATNLQPINGADNLAYIIYTSGSTGMPKGVMIEHGSITNTLQWRRKYYQFDQQDVVLQIPSFSFDSSVEDIFTALISGAKLILVHQQNRFNLNYLKDVIKEQGVSHFLIVPNFYRVMLKEIPEYLQQVRIITVAGDHFTEELVKEHFEILPNTRLCNEYGPTENSVCSTVYEFSPSKTQILIGHPIDNVKCYVLDRAGRPVSTGAAGELCVSGKGLARGYYNRPELTSEKFVANPFIPGERMYKTGDMARWLEDGMIDFLGRMDQQVKIRGYRVELGEIENRILQHEKVKEAVVVAVDQEKKEKFLTGYIVLADLVEEDCFGASELRGYLYNELPEYMVPQYFVFLEKLPLLPNGKIDKRALPIPEASTEVEYVAPRNDVEMRLVEIWAEVLGVEENEIGIDHNFFDLGGHSLKATGFVTKVFKKLNVEVPIRQVFNTPTIRELAEFMQQIGQSRYTAIEPIEEREYYPVSSAQKRLFVLQQLEAVKTSYNVPGAMIIEGALDRQRLEQAFVQFIQRHEALRTSFAFVDEEPVQRIHQDVPFTIDYLEVGTTDCDVEALANGFVQPFDLSQAPLLRVKLVRLSAAMRYLLLFDMHHIISDGISMNILVQEIVQLYEGKELPALRIQYKDYAAWQNELFTSGKIQAEEEYWINEFAGELPVLNLPTDYPRPTVMSFDGDRVHFTVDESVASKLKILAKQEDATLYMVLLAAVNVLLSKYSGQEDIIVGSPIAGRPHADLEEIMGMFVNTLAIRNRPASDKSFNQLLNEVTEKTLKAYENQDYPFEMLVEKMHLERDMSRNPLFTVMFVLQNIGSAHINVGDLQFMPYPMDNKTAKFDLTITGAEHDQGLGFNVQYSTKLYKQATIERMTKHFVRILETVASDPQIKLCEIEMLDAEEKKMLLIDFNNTDADYPKTKTIHQLFEEKVQEVPDHVALVYQNQHITYQQLNQKANQLARTLRAKGVGPDHLVGIMAEPSIETVIGVLAIVKAGGAYLPINPDYPATRIEFMLEDTQAHLVFAKGKESREFHFAGELMDLTDPQIYADDSSNLDNVNSPTDLIYIIYTSGSTGLPKGVMTQHKNVNRLLSNSNLLKITAQDRLLQTGSLAFDASTYEIWGTLLNGAALYLLQKEELLSTERFAEQLKGNQINWLFITTALFNKFAEDDPTIFTNLKTLMVGGETLSTKYINRVKRACPAINLYNIYGPTETTTFATVYLIEHEFDTNIPIGQPLSNTSVYILDRKNKLQPIGIAGELCIGGDGLARGYLNSFELTAEKFTINPYDPEQKIYRSGDLARWLPDGNIEFLGRIDHQVKIRGFRIEPEEIEAELLSHPDIKETIVIDGIDEQGEKYLAAYFVAARLITVSELRNYLLQKAPEYMVPTYFIQLDQMPLNENGKIHRGELPAPVFSLTGREYQAPTTETEKRLAQIWSEILHIEEIGIHENFFEIGGHSLRATTLAAKTLKELNIALPLGQIFKTPTIKALAEYLEAQNTSIYASIEPVALQEYYPLSSAQKRLFILNQLDPANTSYNIAGAMIIEGNLHVGRLEDAFKQFIQRHESLRTSFTLVEGRPVQIVHPVVDFKLDYVVADTEDVDVAVLVKGFIKPFDLQKAPLLRVQLIQLPVSDSEPKRHLFVFDMHHIISDGMSMNILVQEISTLYQAKELPALRIQYKDFAAWQNDRLHSAQFKAQEEFWLQEFAGEVPVLNIPTDYPRAAAMNYAGGRVKFTIEAELTSKLAQLTKETGTTTYMVLLAAYNVLLSKYAGQEDITIGSPFAGRPHVDLENVVGMFINTLAMRNYPVNDKTFREFLEDVKAKTIRAYDNQDYPLDQLVDHLNIERAHSRNPLFDVMFVLQNMEMNPIQLDELKFIPYPLEGKTATFDLVLTAVEGETQIQCNLEYKTGLFKEETAQRLARYYLNILNHVVNNADSKLYDIQMTGEEEKVVFGFNETNVQYADTPTISELFEEQAEKTPGRVAVRFEDQSIKYRDLNKKANQLARVLRAEGVKPDEIVGIRVERSVEMIIGLLAILKAGGAYLPLDPSYPAERLSYMIKDSDMRIMLVDSVLDGDMLENVKTIQIKHEDLYTAEEDTNLEPLSTACNLAYMIYTSGSTGNPKGVMIEHQSIINTLLWRKNFYQFNERDAVLQIPSFSFDSSVEDIFTPLLSGAKVVMIQQEKRLDLNYLQEVIEANHVTHFLVVPNLYHVMLREIAESLEDVRVITVAGDNFTEELVKEHFEKLENVRLCNEYGPTENSVCSTVYEFTPTKTKVLIGKPIDNVSCYIVDTYGKAVSIGAVGELCVAGRGLARGYYKRPELTHEKFVPNPFVPGERMYKTGDSARWLEDGNIEFLGRLDHQVKIRGFRVELGEIENRLLHHEKVDEAVVVALDDKKKINF